LETKKGEGQPQRGRHPCLSPKRGGDRGWEMGAREGKVKVEPGGVRGEGLRVGQL